MDLAAPQLGGQYHGLPGRQDHGLLGGGEARETLQEVEKVVLQTQCAWLHRLSELAVPDHKGRTDHGAGTGPSVEPFWYHSVPQTTHVQPLVNGFQKDLAGDSIRAGERDVGGKDAGAHSETLAVGGVPHAIAWD